MKTTRKNFLGLLGLFLVAAITAFAAMIPTPNAPTASALAGASEKISVRVIGSGPDVSFININNGQTYHNPLMNISFNYNGVKFLYVAMDYMNPLGQTSTYVLTDDEDVNYAAGTWSHDFNFAETYGRGTYTFYAYGRDYSAGVGSPLNNITEDMVQFVYHPGGISSGDDTDPGTDPTDPGSNTPGSNDNNEQGGNGTDNVVLDLGLDPDDPYTKKVIINVYDEEGNLIKELSGIEVYPPFDKVTFPFSEYGLTSGNYTFQIIEYGENNQEIYRYDVGLDYKAPIIPVPNTGAVLANLDISSTDNVITGMIVFGLVAVVSLVVVARGRKERSSKKRS